MGTHVRPARTSTNWLTTVSCSRPSFTTVVGTLPSHLSMLTALHPTVHGVSPHNGLSLDPGRVTLAERLQEAGYATAAFTDGGWMRSKFGFSQGFDLYDEQGGRFQKILPKATEWLHRNYDRPFFLFVHSYDIHSEWDRLPYDCPGGYAQTFTDGFDVDFDGCRDGLCASQLLNWANNRLRSGEVAAGDLFASQEVDFMKALYDGCIRYADNQVGQLLDTLHKLGVYDRTLILVTSDHGEEFGEHGMFLHVSGGYEEIIHIPLILKLPGSQFRGRRVEHLSAMVDLMPTVLDVLSLRPSEQSQGKSLMPAIEKNTPVRQAAVIYSILRTDRWKYFAQGDRLYDLKTDRDEQVNVAGKTDAFDPRLKKLLRRQMEADAKLRREFDQSRPDREQVRLNEKEIRELKALGYLN